MRALLIGVLLLSGCGYSAKDGEAIGQAKKLTAVTPLICEGYVAFDMSLGILKGGSGSMSTQDIWLTVKDGVNLMILKKAVENASIVHIRYDTRRVPFCTEKFILNGVDLVQQ